MKKLTLGDRVLISRRDTGMTQAQLAEAAGVSRTYIKDIEVGHVTNVGVDAITAIATALNVSLAYLMGMSDDPLSESPEIVLAESSGRYVVQEVDNPGLRRLLQDVISSFSALPPDSQVVVYNLIQHMRRVQEEYDASTSQPLNHRDKASAPARGDPKAD